MSKIKQVQTKIDTAQSDLAEKIDSVQADFAEKVDSFQSKVQEAVDSVQDRVETIEGKVEKAQSKLQYGIDWIKAAIETAGLNPTNVLGIAKVIVGQEEVANPIVLPVLKGLVVVQVQKKPKTEQLKAIVDAAVENQ